jgi:hypothetical protein
MEVNLKNKTKFEEIANRLKDSELTQKVKEELWVLAKRGNTAVRKGIGAFLDYVEGRPHVKEWLKSSAVVGITLEMLPFSRLMIMATPGFVPGALAGYMKGNKTNSPIQSAIIGGAVSWPVKPVMMVSPIAGMLLVAFAAGILEETLAESASIAEAA